MVLLNRRSARFPTPLPKANLNFLNLTHRRTLIVRLDKTAPVINVSPPAAYIVVGQAAAADFDCADALSGAAACAALGTSSVGAKSFAVSSTDKAGNVSRKSALYAVGYGVSPQYDQTKVHQSGSTIPVKLRLTDAGGADPDFNFRYDGGGYIFNPKTTGYAPGTYRLLFRAGSDPTEHAVEFRIRQ